MNIVQCRRWFVLGLLAVLSAAACRITAQPVIVSSDAQVTALPAATATASPSPPTPTLPPKPTSDQPYPAFPDCQPDPVELYIFNPQVITPVPDLSEGSPTLRSLAEQRGLLIGTSTAPSVFDDPRFTTLTVRESNIVAVENAMKWEVIHPEPARYDFTDGDAVVDFATANGMQVYGHALAWELQQPEWLTSAEHTREEWIQILCRHVKTVVGHYRGSVYAWVVVNEALQDNGELRDTHWLRVIGPEYIAMAFHWARQADPDALLVYNEHSAEGMNRKSDAVYSLMRGLLRQGLPVDAVGLQMHIWLDGPPTPADLQANMRRLAALGLQVHITEMDVRLQLSNESMAKELSLQAETYRQAMSACLQEAACKVFITWGLTDSYNWISDYTGVTDYPVLFDRDFQPKPAYQALIDILATDP